MVSQRCSFILPMLLILPIGLAGAAPAPFGDSRSIAPVGAKALEGVLFPIPRGQIQNILSKLEAVHVYTDFQGRNDALKTEYAAETSPLRGGEVLEVDLARERLFGTPVPEGNNWLHLAAVKSVDAEAVRLKVDLSALGPDDETWMVDPNNFRAFGPYRSGDGVRWLASIQKDEAVLMVRSPHEEIPNVRVLAFSHIFLKMEDLEKELSCNLDISCETDANILSAASGTAIILVGGQWFCSGTLINNPQTREPQPFFTTANHCVCSGVQARDVEAYWDFRTSGCNSTVSPTMDNLPRSNGTALLATDAVLDATLIRLDTVSAGSYGRTYVGWDTRVPVAGENVLCIHYPQATHARISKGTVVAIDQTEVGRQKQTEVNWQQGVTEQGSSGSCLLFADNLRIFGMLSQGATDTCGADRSGNLDWFSSFRDFYPEIQQYIDDPNPPATEGADDCQNVKNGQCPFQIAYSGNKAKLGQFRALRDKVLRQTPAGNAFVKAYYDIAPALANAVAHSPEARDLFAAITGPFAGFGVESGNGRQKLFRFYAALSFYFALH